jgi:hypothetical protein
VATPRTVPGTSHVKTWEPGSYFQALQADIFSLAPLIM